jgi:hypothetical protein
VLTPYTTQNNGLWKFCCGIFSHDAVHFRGYVKTRLLTFWGRHHHNFLIRRELNGVMTTRPQIKSMALKTFNLVRFTLGFSLYVKKSKIMTAKLKKTTEVLLPSLLHLIFVRFIYLRWVQVGLCNDTSACGMLTIGDGGGWTMVRITFLRLDT